MKDERRLIEEYLPVRAISYEATREKLLRKRDYHLSMLHLWWARRPLAAARAAVYATMVSAEGRTDDIDALAERMTVLCRWASPTDGGRYGINETAIRDASEEILAANGGEPPKILDCFAGGGAIPLEVARLGGQAYAVELNPVAYLIDLCVLVYPQTYGPSLADDVDKWGTWVLERARAEIGDLYPAVGTSHEQVSIDGRSNQTNAAATPVAYLWTRTVPCPNPALAPHDLDLVRQTWLVKRPGTKTGRFIALKPVVNREELSVRYEVFGATSEEGLGFDPTSGSERGNASCRICGASVSADDVKVLAKQGNLGRRLIAMATVTRGTRGKAYLGSEEATAFVPNADTLAKRLAACVDNTGLDIPETPVAAADNQHFQAPMYGMRTVGSLFTDRQQLALLTLCGLVRDAHAAMLSGGMDEGHARAVATYLGMAIDRVADRGSSLCHWDNSRETTANTYARQALPMVWDFSETNPFGPSSGNLASAIDAVAKVIRHCAEAGEPAVVTRGSATDPVPGGPFDAVITDPPYYDNISYADLSDFFYAWLQRSIGHLYPEHFAGPLTPKKKEAVAAPYRHGGSDTEARAAYDDMMAEVFTRRREELKPGAPLVVVYAHKTYAGWATLINALRRSGFVVTEAWPLDTEMPTRAGGQGTASLASSIFLVARRRENGGTGDWSADVYPELQRIVAERVQDLPDRGVSGDDLVIAAIGAGLRAYTAYDRVEMPNGDELPPERYLEEVQREVIETVLADVFGLARSGIQAVDPATQFYVMGRFEFGDAYAEFDKANTLGKGVGVELSGASSLLRGRSALLHQEKGKVRFRDFEQRGATEGLGEPDDDDPSPPPLIDSLHRLLWLSQHQTADVRDFIRRSHVDVSRLRTVAQALSGEALAKKGLGTSGGEQTAIASLLGSWKRLIDDNLFGGAS